MLAQLQSSLHNCCKKGTLGDTYLLFRCADCADLPEHLPWWCSVLAPECLWKYLFCKEVGRDRRGMGRGGPTVFAHVRIVSFSFCLMHKWKIQKTSMPLFNLGVLQTPTVAADIWISVQWRLFIYEKVWWLSAVCCWGCYQLIPVITGAFQTNSWKPIKATYYVITSSLSPETPR